MHRPAVKRSNVRSSKKKAQDQARPSRKAAKREHHNMGTHKMNY